MQLGPLSDPRDAYELPRISQQAHFGASDVLLCDHPLDAYLTDAVVQHGAELELRSFCILGLAPSYRIA